MPNNYTEGQENIEETNRNITDSTSKIGEFCTSPEGRATNWKQSSQCLNNSRTFASQCHQQNRAVRTFDDLASRKHLQEMFRFGYCTHLRILGPMHISICIVSICIVSTYMCSVISCAQITCLRRLLKIGNLSAAEIMYNSIVLDYMQRVLASLLHYMVGVNNNYCRVELMARKESDKEVTRNRSFCSHVPGMRSVAMET